MKVHPNVRLRFVACLGILSLVLFGAPGVRATVDLNGNGESDIWELIYGASGLNPGVDTDGDTVINQLESIAGTNPFDSNSVPKISYGTLAGTNFAVTINGALGKQYQLQSSQGLDATPWTNWLLEASMIARTGTVVTLTAPAGPVAKFFRISISDVDSDGDGVNDWEEYQLGLDPFNAYSNGQLDGNGNPLNDYQYVVGQLAVENVITISATDPTAVEPDPGQPSTSTGQYTISRGGFPLNSITVSLALGGPGTGFAIPGKDHAPLPTSMFFPVGVSSQTITLTPLANTNLAAPVIAMLKLLPGAGYTNSTQSNASVVIYPSPTAKGIGLTGTYYTNSSTTYTNSANFNATNLILTRIDPVVDFSNTVWGTSTNLPIPSKGDYCVRWTGQVQPPLSDTYFFDVRSIEGANLWVNDQLRSASGRRRV